MSDYYLSVVRPQWAHLSSSSSWVSHVWKLDEKTRSGFPNLSQSVPSSRDAHAKRFPGNSTVKDLTSCEGKESNKPRLTLFKLRISKLFDPGATVFVPILLISHSTNYYTRQSDLLLLKFSCSLMKTQVCSIKEWRSCIFLWYVK